MEYYGLEEPCDSIMDLLIHVCKRDNKIKSHHGYDGAMKKVYDVEVVAQMMIKSFFDGHLGKIMMDNDILFADVSKNELGLDKFI